MLYIVSAISAMCTAVLHALMKMREALKVKLKMQASCYSATSATRSTPVCSTEHVTCYYF